MKITPEHFKRFKNACERLIHQAGLVHYSRTYNFSLKEKFAGQVIDFENLHTQLTLTSRQLSDQDMQIFRSPEHMAIHEVGHLLIAEQSSLADLADKEAAAKEDEMIVQRFENLLCSLLTAEQIRNLGK